MYHRFSIEERIYTVLSYARKELYPVFKVDFESIFNTTAPTRKTVYLIFQKFIQTGSVDDAPRSGRKSLHNERVGALLEIYSSRPRTSIRRSSFETEIPKTSINRILSHELGLSSYTIQTVQYLLPTDYKKRLDMCELLMFMDRCLGTFENLLFSDEAIFHVCNCPNRQIRGFGPQSAFAFSLTMFVILPKLLFG